MIVKFRGENNYFLSMIFPTENPYSKSFGAKIFIQFFPIFKIIYAYFRTNLPPNFTKTVYWLQLNKEDENTRNKHVPLSETRSHINLFITSNETYNTGRAPSAG